MGSRRSGIHICLITTSILVIIAVVIAIALGLTVFRPRDPDVTIYLVGLKDHNLTEFLFATNVSTTMIISIDNGNYAGFAYENATTLVLYHDDVVGEVPMLANEIPPRSQVNITTSAILMASVLKDKAVAELGTGMMNLTSKVTLYGKSSLLGVKLKTSAHTECNLTIVLGVVLSGMSTCWSRLKFV
ncbi:hypothetical protein LINPERPRIM_LOCUS1842 [Linum perenne]